MASESPSPAATEPVYTLPEIARQLGVTIAQAKYAVDSYRLEPAGRAGNVRLWTGQQREEIARAISRIRGDDYYIRRLRGI